MRWGIRVEATVLALVVLLSTLLAATVPDAPQWSEAAENTR